jgi:hypothetical protein
MSLQEKINAYKEGMVKKAPKEALDITLAGQIYY